MDKRCTVCDKVYFAKRSTSKFCSATCRKAYSRDIRDDPEIGVKSEKCSDCFLELGVVCNKHNPWFNSAETKTQAEIEEHYSLKNFPRVKYYSQNGGGSGALSPYPLSDPRSQAYL